MSTILSDAHDERDPACSSLQRASVACHEEGLDVLGPVENNKEEALQGFCCMKEG